ncbi:MAG TPA: hypothetical protein VG759_16595, partial [Candidatus Angelobacter sp.]|nr:hypothetical protein [Candidatus Angelobacter sp.]
LVQRELMRTGKNAFSLVSRIMERHGRPVYTKLLKLIEAGSENGDFRKVDPPQALTSILGVIIFYFISLPAQHLMSSGDPFAPERITARRTAVLDFISAALFCPKSQPKGKQR